MEPKVTKRDREAAQRWMNEGSLGLQCEHDGDYPECPECFQDLTLLLARHREEAVREVLDYLDNDPDNVCDWNFCCRRTVDQMIEAIRARGEEQHDA